MAAPTVDLERASLILVEAMFYGDKRAAKKWQIAPVTVERYRKRLNTDSELKALVVKKRREYEQDWVKDIPIAVRGGIQWLSQAFLDLEPTAENVHAVAGAIKLLTEIGLTKELIDARLGKLGNEYGEANNQVVGRLSDSSTS
jgi:hypothetical protein